VRVSLTNKRYMKVINYYCVLEYGPYDLDGYTSVYPRVIDRSVDMSTAYAKAEEYKKAKPFQEHRLSYGVYLISSIDIRKGLYSNWFARRYGDWQHKYSYGDSNYPLEYR